MKFRSNKCMAIHVANLAVAEKFYSQVMGFKLLAKTKKYLEYQTGHFLLYVNKDAKKLGPIPSFTVADIHAARTRLTENGCTIVDERKSSFYFSDPFGVVYDVIED